MIGGGEGRGAGGGGGGEKARIPWRGAPCVDEITTTPPPMPSEPAKRPRVDGSRPRAWPRIAPAGRGRPSRPGRRSRPTGPGPQASQAAAQNAADILQNVLPRAVPAAEGNAGRMSTRRSRFGVKGGYR